MAQEHGKSWPRPTAEANTDGGSTTDDPTTNPLAEDAPSSFSLPPSSFPSPPPDEDFSPVNEEEPRNASPPTTPNAQTHETTTACDENAPPAQDAPQPQSAPSHPLLTNQNSLPVTELQLTPTKPGTLITDPATPVSPSLHPSIPPSPCPLSPDP